MPRRNLASLIFVIIFCAFCYQKNERARSLETLNLVMNKVQDNWYRDIEQEDLIEGAIEGITGKLDPYSDYYSRAEYKALSEHLDQEFGGIGIQVTFDKETKQVRVVSPLLDTPAYRGGIEAGDIILAIDKESLAEKSLEDATKVLRGKPGEKVTLTIKRGEAEPKDYVLAREYIHPDSVKGDLRNEDDHWNFLLQGEEKIGYIRVEGFGPRTADELREAITQITEQEAEGLILDFRGNPGGHLDAAVDICDMFIEEGLLVSTKNRQRFTEQSFYARKGNTVTDLPLAVLVDKMSASASEIVAACLQDYGRAKIVGVRSYGKGSVQNIIELDNGRSALKLTIATFYGPNGKNIHRTKDATEEDTWGVTPDEGYLVDMTLRQRAELQVYRRDRDIIQPKSKTHKAPSDAVAVNQVPEDSTKPIAQSGTVASASDPSDATKTEDNGTIDFDSIHVDSTVPQMNVDPQLKRAIDYLKTAQEKPSKEEAA